MNKLLKKPYIFWVIGIFLAYLVINIIISEFYVTLINIPRYFNTINWYELGFSILFSLIIALLVAFNSVYGYIKYREYNSFKKRDSNLYGHKYHVNVNQRLNEPDQFGRVC